MEITISPACETTEARKRGQSIAVKVETARAEAARQNRKVLGVKLTAAEAKDLEVFASSIDRTVDQVVGGVPVTVEG